MFLIILSSEVFKTLSNIMLEIFAQAVTTIQLVTIFAKGFILYVWQGHKQTSIKCDQIFGGKIKLKASNKGTGTMSLLSKSDKVNKVISNFELITLLWIAAKVTVINLYVTSIITKKI